MRAGEFVRRLVRIPAAIAALTMAASMASANDPMVGSWLTDQRDGIVQIRPCGSQICGYVQAILAVPEPGRKLLDNRNEKPALRLRPLCGLPILGKLQKLAANTWGNGWIYDPKTGKTWDVELTLAKHDVLSVRGYYGVKTLGQTVIWTRARPNSPKCKS
ncbi:MAG: DUF2147 domain-containing protein [Xanthobacteraceae bacterium]